MITDSDSEINNPLKAELRAELKPRDSEPREKLRGFKDIFENEISEPEIMQYCKGDQGSLELLQKYSTLAKEQNYETLILSIQNAIYDELLDPEKKTFFVRNFYLGIAYFRRQSFEDSLRYFLEANKIYKFYQLHYNIGLCYMRLNKLENAVYYFDTVTKENKNNIFSYYNLIKIFLRQKNFNDAYLLYHEFMEVMKKEGNQVQNDNGERLTANKTNYMKIFYKIGAECCFAKSLYQECIHTILEGLKFNPEDADLWCLYGKIFIIKKIYNFAKPLLLKALQFDPNHRESKELIDIVNRIDID